MAKIEVAGWTLPAPILDIGLVVLAICAALFVHFVAIRILLRITKRTGSQSGDVLVDVGRGPLRWILVALALTFIRSALSLGAQANAIWKQAAGLIVPLLVGWLVIALIRAWARIVELHWDISVADNLRARRRRTRSMILTRIATLVVGFVTICLMLLSIPGVRSVGVTLMASAGLVALAVGAAAQPALKNLIAGIQMAFTEPIRLDDVVIIDGEWGKIEEIRLTYVVVAIWDERRLVVPVSKFLDDSFQNWTRQTATLLGSAFFYLDPTADISRLRAKYEEVVKSNPRWDGRGYVLQVTDVKPEAIEVRVLATAADAAIAFDLRCDIREAMLAFIRDEMPEALPRNRTRLEPGTSIEDERNARINGTARQTSAEGSGLGDVSDISERTDRTDEGDPVPRDE
ncbi:mechanosensitive ion channel [Stakelama sediminis]|uniref:Small-conductance mechanosensitive channel n=1 Tax=Stakelama sediminis TaxID=463200 RepID=A0A840YZ12_9SPHN|nr:mechanosensitive ion channel family protein [Stakelama sediminis]MBB5718883.1 small-conductance mechanosensitive channel [Stakelama sediminis]